PPGNSCQMGSAVLPCLDPMPSALVDPDKPHQIIEFSLDGGHVRDVSSKQQRVRDGLNHRLGQLVVADPRGEFHHSFLGATCSRLESAPGIVLMVVDPLPSAAGKTH